jgi:hypothetical protein
MADAAGAPVHLGDPEEVFRRLFRNGDPDADEFSDFTDFALLKLSGRAAEGGVVRILCHLINHRYRLVMRNAAATGTLLNHFLVPGLQLYLAERSVAYTVDDYSSPGDKRTIQVQLTFAGPEVRSYFQAKFEGGVRANRTLVYQAVPPAVDLAREFPPSGGPFDGIIAHLTRECHGNVHDKGVVLVTSSPPFSDAPCYLAKNVVDGSADTFFTSADFPSGDWRDIPHTRNNWICLDFQEQRVVVTHYSIRTASQSHRGNANPRSWIVEVSADGENWVEIDKKEDTNVLNDGNVTTMFKATAAVEGRFVRLVNVGRNHYGSDKLFISGIEIFGTLTQ